MHLLRGLFLCLLLSFGFSACEKKPTVEEVQAAARQAEQAKATPTPKPGDWMWKKDRKNPLDEKAK